MLWAMRLCVFDVRLSFENRVHYGTLIKKLIIRGNQNISPRCTYYYFLVSLNYHKPRYGVV